MTELSANPPDFSLVIPVYNEEAVLPLLFARLDATLPILGRTYEVVFVNDGSRDRSAQLLKNYHDSHPNHVRVVLLGVNCGQHNAIIAGFLISSGRYVITIDADLQTPPEEISKLLAQLDKGFDYVGSIRRQRHDVAWRRWASRVINQLRERITSVHMTDHGCMLRGFHRSIIQAILASNETVTFIPALAYLFSARPVEIEVEHTHRVAGTSKYPLSKLIRLNFDLMTGFSTMPLHVFSLVGMGISLSSLLFVIYMAWRRLILGPEVEGVFTLFGILFFLVGICLFGIGLLGEYVGRIYQQVLKRPRFMVDHVLGAPSEPLRAYALGHHREEKP